ncbi:MAG: hypothetical protein SGI72_01970 [Planctomycetota bacterium]|nr:hypothetical protein [Planctomycetota bacterium]
MVEFLHHQLRSPSLRMEITGRPPGAHPTLKKISIGARRSVPVRAPSIATQRAMVGALDDLSTAAAQRTTIYARKLAGLDEMKKSLLHQAFRSAL